MQRGCGHTEAQWRRCFLRRWQPQGRPWFSMVLRDPQRHANYGCGQSACTTGHFTYRKLASSHFWRASQDSFCRWGSAQDACSRHWGVASTVTLQPVPSTEDVSGPSSATAAVQSCLTKKRKATKLNRAENANTTMMDAFNDLEDKILWTRQGTGPAQNERVM